MKKLSSTHGLGLRVGKNPGRDRIQFRLAESPQRVLVKDLTARYHLSQETITRMTGFSLRAVANWRQGSKPSASTARRFIEVKRLFTALEDLVRPEAIGSWFREPNPAFDGSTPLQVIERGEADRIWRMVYELQSGEPG